MPPHMDVQSLYLLPGTPEIEVLLGGLQVISL